MPLISERRAPIPWRGFGSVEERNRWMQTNRPEQWAAEGGTPAIGTTAAPAATTGPGAASPGSLAGAPAFSYAGAYGGIPQVPSPQATQTASITGNLAALPEAQKLAEQTNAFNISQAPAPYIANLPNYQNLLGQTSGNALALARGELPADVVYQLGQAAAERGATVGAAPGSPNTNTAYLKALGLNSLQAQQTGLNQFGQLMGLTPTAPLMNPATQFVTPEEQQAAQMAANVFAAAPVPAQKAAADLAALRSGVGAGRGSVGTPAYSPTISSPTIPRMPTLTPPTFVAAAPPTAPGRSYDPNAYTSSRVEGGDIDEPDYPGADASLDEIYDWLGIGETGDFPGAPDYEQVPGFESLYEDFETA